MTGVVKEYCLDAVPLFESLAERERADLGKGCTWVRFDAHEQIFDRAAEGTDTYFVIDGKVRVVNFSLQGREISFNDVGAGGFFGELAAIDGMERSASVVALKPTLVAAMPSAVFKKVVAEHPVIAHQMVMHLAQMVRRATERIMDLSTLGANNRVHAELLRLARESGRVDEEAKTAVIDPIPVHSDLAARVSTTRETVARVLGELQRDGIVHRKEDHLLIADYETLEWMVEDVRGV